MKIIGESPLAMDEQGQPKVRIATAFPLADTLITLPGIHATQRLAFTDELSRLRVAAGGPPLTGSEELAQWQQSVDLMMEDGNILIGADPQNMDLAFAADQMLQGLLPKERIRFQHASDPMVRAAIKRRGELWRLRLLPRSTEEMKRLIETSRMAIGGRAIYYYSGITGTRLLTCQAFAGLGCLGDDELRLHLKELRDYYARHNRRGNPEIAFFMAGPAFHPDALVACDWDSLAAEPLRAAFEAMRQALWSAVPAEFRGDNVNEAHWRAAMYAALVPQPEGLVPEEALLGLSPEFFMHIDWLPGARIHQGELIFDPVFEQVHAGQACDEKVRGFIFDFLREYDDVEYINVGRVVSSLGARRAQEGQRGVYIAEMKQKGGDRPIVRIIRLQKWDVVQRMEKGLSLAEAVLRSEEYTEYVLDRRMGCRQLGMAVPMRITTRKVLERCQGAVVWSPYFERDYVRGMATDKISTARLEDPVFALKLAGLLGEAAAPNLIVGRADDHGKVIFDDGDEVLIEAEDGRPMRIVIADPTGAFALYHADLGKVIRRYAEPVNRRSTHVPDARAFADAYVSAFQRRFSEIQQQYRDRPRAFHLMFRDRPRDESGSFAYRWECVLRRLDQADPREMAAQLKASIGAGTA